MHVTVDGRDVSYAVQGQGRTVVLVHGWGDDRQGMAAMQHDLAASYKVVSFDLPGFGDTDAPEHAWTLDSYGRFMAMFLEAIATPRPYGLVAHSNGAAMTVRGLANRSLAAERVILLGSSGIPNEYKGHAKPIRYLAQFGKRLAQVLPSSVQEMLQRKVYKTMGPDVLVPEELQQTYEQVITDDIRPDAPQLTMPVLLIYGADDASTPPWYGEQLVELMPDAQLQVLPGAGHFVHVDKQAEVLQSIKEFLS